MHRQLHTPLHLISDLGAQFLDEILRFLCRDARKAFCGHFSHNHWHAHVGLLQKFPTSLPCPSSRHVEYLRDISCCFKRWNSAITSTIYSSIACSKLMKASLIHTWGCVSGDSSTKLPELTTSWCCILRTVRVIAFVTEGGFLIPAPMNWLCSSLCTPAVCYTSDWRLST